MCDQSEILPPATYSLYIILLECGKYFIFYSNANHTPAQILVECEVLYAFPKQFKPLRIWDKVDSGYAVDTFVKEYMVKYGICHVRGGSYLSPVLPKYLIDTLELEFKTLAMEVDELHKPMQRFITSADKNIDHLQSDLALYKRIKFELHKLQYFWHQNVLYEIGYNILYDIEWLQDHIMSQLRCCCITRDRYQCLLIKLQRVLYLFFLFNDEIQIVNGVQSKTIFHSNPEFIFDNFIYHVNTPFFKQIDISVWINLCDDFTTMTKFLMNQIKQFKNKLSTYPEHMETLTAAKIYYSTLYASQCLV